MYSQKILLDDELPKVVCKVCSERLEFYVKFYKKCHATQERLVSNFISVAKATVIDTLHELPSGRGAVIKEGYHTVATFSGLIDRIASAKSSTTKKSSSSLGVSSILPQVSIISPDSSDVFSEVSYSIDCAIKETCQEETLASIENISQSTVLSGYSVRIPTYISIKDGGLVSFVPVKLKGTGDQTRCQVAIPRYPSKISVLVDSGLGSLGKFVQARVVPGMTGKESDKLEAAPVQITRRKLVRIPASKSVAVHVEKVSSSIYQCKLCGSTFKHNFLCEYHVRSHIGEEPFVCSVCSKRFVASYLLKRHQRSHEEGCPHVCKTCGKGFRSSFNLKEHEKIHLDGPAPFKCETCQKSFYFRTSYLGHMSTHEDRKRLGCDSCGKSYMSKRHLKEHVERVHNSIARHFCPTCNKGFYRNTTFKLHMRLHTSERPFSCQVCGHSFNEKVNLERHKKVHSKKNAILLEGKSVLKPNAQCLI